MPEGALRPEPNAAEAPRVARKPLDPSTAGTVHGVVRYEGPPPASGALPLTTECASLHKEPVKQTRLLADAGLLANALVFVSRGAEAWEPPPAPTTEAVLDQKGCVYETRVLGVRVGQPIAIVNSDPVLHNVHALAKTNGGFNLSMPTRGERATKRFGKPEVVQLKCDVHPWMGARIGVFENPWYAVSDARGEFTIADLPPGDYVLTASHEELGERTANVTVGAKGTAEVTFSFARP
jgi:plastocyanin